MTKIIYLNEQDKPKPLKVLNFSEWYNETQPFPYDSVNIKFLELNSLVNEYNAYQSKTIKQLTPIQLTELIDTNSDTSFMDDPSINPKSFDYIIVLSQTEFLAGHYSQTIPPKRYKGELNSGTV